MPPLSAFCQSIPLPSFVRCGTWRTAGPTAPTAGPTTPQACLWTESTIPSVRGNLEPSGGHDGRRGGANCSAGRERRYHAWQEVSKGFSISSSLSPVVMSLTAPDFSAVHPARRALAASHYGNSHCHFHVAPRMSAAASETMDATFSCLLTLYAAASETMDATFSCLLTLYMWGAASLPIR